MASRRADRGGEADRRVLLIEGPEADARQREEHGLAHVRLIEVRHLAREREVVDRVAAHVRLLLAGPGDAGGTNVARERRDLVGHEPGPAGTIQRAVPCP